VAMWIDMGVNYQGQIHNSVDCDILCNDNEECKSHSSIHSCTHSICGRTVLQNIVDTGNTAVHKNRKLPVIMQPAVLMQP
jgi:hypothetical protein